MREIKERYPLIANINANANQLYICLIAGLITKAQFKQIAINCIYSI